ncbi:hypothetical protein ACFFHM_03880 [Halalkalibacter kiskunsagensis]|uniref:Uncharacterized protein n=1 Tax=Halalkalibacter kiskunsagensis TaxID=1548599 RepID=A0ABV6K8Q0_9BACI
MGKGLFNMLFILSMIIVSVIVIHVTNNATVVATNEVGIPTKPANEEFSNMMISIQEELTTYEEVENIVSDFQQFVTVQTTLSPSNPDTKHRAQEIKKVVDNVLRTNKLDQYQIQIQSISGEDLE